MDKYISEKNIARALKDTKTQNWLGYSIIWWLILLSVIIIVRSSCAIVPLSKAL